MQTKVEICGVNTAGLTVLRAEETDALLRQATAGDRAARDRLIRGNLRLVLSVVQRFHGRGESPDDMFQVGCIGLMKAIDHFDINLGVRFSTYAVPMIICSGKRSNHIDSQSGFITDFRTKEIKRRAKEKKNAVLQHRPAGFVLSTAS